jgi:hypothetical protein
MEEIKKILWVMNPGVTLRVSKSKVFVTIKFEKNTFKTFFETTMKLLRVDCLDYDTVASACRSSLVRIFTEAAAANTKSRYPRPICGVAAGS